MDSTTTSADRRSAHRRVGAAAILAFLALLLLGATHGPAQADQIVPMATPTVEPSEPSVPAPGGDDPDFDGGGRPDFHGGGPDFDHDGGGGPGFDGSGTAPAPSSPAPSTSDGGSQT